VGEWAAYEQQNAMGGSTQLGTSGHRWDTSHTMVLCDHPAQQH
jgi:hypothetical protein